MDSSNQDQLRQWVAGQTACLAPPADWQPDTGAARRRFEERKRAHLWRPVWSRRWMAAAAVLAGAILLFTAGRAAAQLWQMLTVRRLAIVRVNPWPADVPSPAVKLLGTPIPPIPARDIDEVRWRVKYDPRLPHAGVLAGEPRLSTTFGVGAGTVVHSADLELALRKVGVTDRTVPAEWDGAQIGLHSSAVVIAEWPDILLVQSLPLTLTAPPGFDFPAFSALILRILGVAPEEAQRLAQETGTTPPWLAPLNRDMLRDRCTLEEIKLNSGPATLLQQGSRVTILWMVPDRVYLLDAHIDRGLAIAAANAVE